MSEPDLCALEAAGGLDVGVAVLPTAAAPDNNQDRAGRNALHWFRSLGASAVEVVPVIDRASADDPALAEVVAAARFIYMLGGFPRYLGETLRGSRVWDAAMLARAQGAVVGGSSAGAMVLCEQVYDPESAEVFPGLGLLSGCCVLPHFNSFGRSWVKKLAARLASFTLIGIDERTGALESPSGIWTVYGAGQVTLQRSGRSLTFDHGATFRLDAL